MTTKVILDVDTGIDDAFALLFAARTPLLELLGVTCVDGNAKLDYVVRNTLHVLSAAGNMTVPVAAGAVQPLMGGELGAEEVHGSDGLAGLSPQVAPSPPTSPQTEQPSSSARSSWLTSSLHQLEPLTCRCTLRP
jgi:inosine-uridine nucleoside N-ribohydrolase